MAVLEFIQVLIAIILGLGIAELLKGVADYLRASEVRGSPVLFSFAAWLGLVHVQFWWAGWRFRDVDTWIFPELALHVTGPVFLYVAARLTFPTQLEGADLPAYFEQQRRTIWHLVALFMLTAILGNVLLLGAPLVSAGPLSQAGLALVALIAARSSRRPVQAIAVALLLVQTAWRTTIDIVG